MTTRKITKSGKPYNFNQKSANKGKAKPRVRNQCEVPPNKWQSACVQKAGRDRHLVDDSVKKPQDCRALTKTTGQKHVWEPICTRPDGEPANLDKVKKEEPTIKTKYGYQVYNFGKPLSSIEMKKDKIAKTKEIVKKNIDLPGIRVRQVDPDSEDRNSYVSMIDGNDFLNDEKRKKIIGESKRHTRRRPTAKRLNESKRSRW